jgi:hypothetical protein
MKYKLLLAVLIINLTGCANFTQPARVHSIDKEGKIYWFDYDASRRGALLYKFDPDEMDKNPRPIRYCAEPTPDVALSLINELKLSQPEGAEASASFNTSVVKLAERTQMVQFLREALYRLCEQSLNETIQYGEIKDAYLKVIEAALAMAEADRENAKIALIEATKK